MNNTNETDALIGTGSADAGATAGTDDLSVAIGPNSSATSDNGDGNTAVAIGNSAAALSGAPAATGNAVSAARSADSSATPRPNLGWNAQWTRDSCGSYPASTDPPLGGYRLTCQQTWALSPSPT